MKFVAVVVLFGLLMVVSGAKKCSNQKDCEEGECCLAGDIPLMFKKGTCTALGKEGKDCRTKNIFTDTVRIVYRHSCPCRKGLKCESTEEEDFFGLIKIKGKCVADVASTTPKVTTKETEAPTQETVAPTQESVAPTQESVAPTQEE